MNILVPVIFKSLILLPTPSASQHIGFETDGTNTIDMVVDVDSMMRDNIKIVVSDALGHSGGTRRIISTYRICDSDTDNVVPVDILDGGSWGMEGFMDSFYFTDPKKETISGWFTVDDASPVFSEAPEGGTTVEFTDRITLTVLNHDTAEKSRYVLRDNQVTYKMDGNGTFTLSSIRPKPVDIEDVSRTLRIYYLEGENPDDPVDVARLAILLRKMFPIPGRAGLKN